jgi:hypothetical protein
MVKSKRSDSFPFLFTRYMIFSDTGAETSIPFPTLFGVSLEKEREAIFFFFFSKFKGTLQISDFFLEKKYLLR